MIELNILFFGLGSIGQRHSRLIKKYYDYELYAYRSRLGQEKYTNDGIEEIYTLRDAFDSNPDIAFITNPTNLHIETALKCAKKGIDLFIEKPLSNSMYGINKLSELVDRKNLFVYVAFNMRFHPVLQELKKMVPSLDISYARTIATSYLPKWRPNQDYRFSYSVDADRGGGVLLELVHEFDYNYWLFGNVKKIVGRYGKISNLDIKCEDFGDLLIEYENGILGNIHFNVSSFNNERLIEIYCEDKYIEGNLINNYIKIIDENGNTKLKRFNVERDETYKKQLEYFFEHYKSHKKHMNDLKEASQILKYLLDFKLRYRIN